MARQSHSFSVEDAEEYGIECAILINHFKFWIEQNQAMGRNFHDGRTWMYQTQAEIAAIYPYWSEDVVFKTIKKLVDLGVLRKGNYNKSCIDRTLWYSFENEKMFTKPSNDGMDSAKRRNANRQMTDSIPDTNPNTDLNDDDDACEKEKKAPYEIEVISPSGKKSGYTKSEVYRFFVGKPYKTETIERAIKRFLERKDRVSDFYKYLETVCATIESNDHPIETKRNNKEKVKKDPEPEQPKQYAEGCGEGGWFEIEKQFKEKLKNKKENS
jgi:hypothetical protein